MKQSSVVERLARFNRIVTNPIQRTWAGYLPPWAIVEHVGRKSGRNYRTPVLAFIQGDIVTIRLPYGAERDWVRNLQAGNGGVLLRRGKRLQITDPEIVPGRRAAMLRLRTAGPRSAQ
jgi:deazaflavin-dependent oxidoreductase (nitroreductase family)